MKPEEVERMLSLVDDGGWLVSSAKCSPQEIAWARTEQRFFVWDDADFLHDADSANPESDK